MFPLHCKPSINHGSWSDKLNSSWTFGLFLLLSIVTWLRHYIGPNAVCVSPPATGDQLNIYVEQTCWLSRQLVYDHKSVPFHNRDVAKLSLIQNENRDYEDINRSLYQSLPLILFMQALFFGSPDVIVRSCDNLFGIRFSRITNLLESYSKLESAEKNVTIRDITAFLVDYFESNSLGRRKHFGIVSRILIANKIVILINVVTQFILFNSCLEVYGAKILQSVLSSHYSNAALSLTFPRQIQCLVYVRRPQHLSIHSAQCSLPINDFYEMVCLIAWIWMAVASCAAIFSVALFIIKALKKSTSVRTVMRCLNMADMDPEQHKVASFIESVFGYDGIILIELIGELSSDILARDIAVKIWKAYMHNERPAENSSEYCENTYLSKSKLTLQVNGKRINQSSYSLSTTEGTPMIDRRYNENLIV